MSKKSHQIQKYFKIICYQNGEILHDFKLSQSHTLIGKADNADIQLSTPHISHYHGMILLEDTEGGKIIDLDSQNGIFLNGQRIQAQSYFTIGDKLTFGELEFCVEEYYEQEENILHFQNYKEQVENLDSQAPSLQINNLPPIEGLVVIDDEYCDITFKEEQFTPISPLDIEHFSYDKNYVDFQEEPEELQDLVPESVGKSLQVSILSMGTPLSIDFLPLDKDRTFSFSGGKPKKNSLHLPILDIDQEVIFANYDGRQVSLKNIEKFNCHEIIESQLKSLNIDTQYALGNEQIISYQYQTIQIIIEIVDTPSSLRRTPFFGIDKAFRKEAGQTFSALMSLMLLLLFVDTSIEPPPKKVSVIYRKAVEAPKVSDQKSSSEKSTQDKGLGIKKNKQPKTETKMAKKAAPQKKPLKTKPQKKVAKSKAVKKAAPTKTVAKKAPKMKAYKFKMKKSMSALFNDSSAPTKVAVNSRKPASVEGIQTSGADNAKTLSHRESSNVAGIGQDSHGDYDSSSGAEGLASKKGIDTTYANTKTVILGSIDPELLRKILREHLPQFRHCYQQELEVNEMVKGVVDLNFRIAGNGQVNKVDIKAKNSQFSSGGVDCMARVLRLIDFPKPKGGGLVDVKQPLNFLSERNRI